MTFRELYGQAAPAFSFEVFPPKQAEGVDRLRETIQNLMALKPALITVTYGAMGSTNHSTQSLVIEFRKHFHIPVASHLTCIQATQASIHIYIQTLIESDVRYVVALRGDIPAGTAPSAVVNDFKHGADLVAYIKAQFPEISIAVAGYPEKHTEAPDMASDIRHLKQKVDAGADAVITQLFYNNEDFFRFRDRCQTAGIQVPIVPGLMPVLNFSQIKRITSMCGAHLPAALLRGLEKHQHDPEELLKYSVDWTLLQAKGLISAKVPGIHFYVLNKADAAADIVKNLLI
jgi:methylenetetrahydrofolate reductase (NADPH)